MVVMLYYTNMSGLISAFRLVLQRSLANWKLLSSIVVGVLVAVSLVSSTPLFSNALSDLGLRHDLNQSQKELLDVNIYAPDNSASLKEYQDLRSLIDQQVNSYIGSVISKQERSMQTQTFSVAKKGQPVDTSPTHPIGHFWAWTNLYQHVRLVEGRYPNPSEPVAQPGESQSVSPDLTIEALIGVDTAKLYNVKTGDELIYFTDLWGNGPAQITVRVTGIIEPLDTNDEYWFLTPQIFNPPPDPGVIVPLFVPEETMFNVLTTVFPNGKLTYNWYYYTDQTRINSLNAKTVANNLNNLQQNLITKSPRVTIFSNLASVIKGYLNKQLFTQIPLFLLIFQIVGIILYYVATVASMVIDQETTEIALLRSRGANTIQVFGILFIEGLLISAVGGLAGPFLGGFVFGLLGKTGPFRPLSGDSFLPVRFSSMVFILAAVTAALCLLAFMLPAIQAARRGIVQQRQQLVRPPRTPFWQRYYLDIMLLVIGGGLYYELRQRGTLVQQNFFGQLGIDPLLLITPILFMIAVAIIFLRLFPLILLVFEKLGKYIANSSIIISLRHMARNPIHYSRLILLLMLAASVGTFSASFLGTLNRSYYDRTMYSVGTDVRLEGLTYNTSGKQALTERYAAIPGVQDISVAYRGTATIGTLFTQTDNTVLAVDPASMEKVGWFRSDFADKSLPNLMAELASDKPLLQGLILPENSETLGLWVRPFNQQRVNIHLWARIEDGNNQYWDFDLGALSSEDWQYLTTSIKRPGSDEPLPGLLTLHTIWINTTGVRSGAIQGLYLDNLQVHTIGTTDPTIIETFDETSIWTPLNSNQYEKSLSGVGQTQDSLYADSTVFHDGQKSACWSWMGGNSSVYRGLFPNLDTRPIEAIVSRSFLKNNGLKIGDWLNIRAPGQYLTIQVGDVVDYFPTLDPQKNDFMLLNLDRLLTLRNRQLGPMTPIYANEVWLSLTPNKTTRAAAIETLNQPDYRGGGHLYDSKQIIADQESDPLISAGWGGVLTLAFCGVALVSTLGFIVYAYLSARERQLEFAILRTLGFSFRQIITLIGFEQIFIIVAGMGIGTYVGIRLSGIMMPFLQLTEGGEKVLPPFVFVTDWKTVLTTYGILGVVFVITISLVVFYFSRVSLNRTLRMGDQ